MRKTEGKIIDRIAKQEFKKSAYMGDIPCFHFTVGFKAAFRRITGNEVVYDCSNKCNVSNCTCDVPKILK